MKIVLVRHGQSEANRDRIIQGHMDFPLSDLGIKQAEEMAEYLAANNYSFHSVYSSDLSRAKTTADIICKKFQINQIKTDERLREFNLGIYQGRKNDEMTAEDNAFLQSCWKDDLKRVPEGENVKEMKARIKAAFTDILSSNNSNATILIVGHGGSLFHILDSTLHIFPKNADWFENCKLNEIVQKDRTDDWILTVFNGKKLVTE